MDIALGDRNKASDFFGKLDFKENNVIKFFIDCSDEKEWKKRHKERFRNPLPHQSFDSFRQIKEYYGKFAINPFDDEYIIDSVNTVENCFEKILYFIEKAQKNNTGKF